MADEKQKNMLGKYLKSALLSPLLAWVFFLGAQTGFAAQDSLYETYDVTLRPSGDYLQSEVILNREPFSAIAFQLDHVVQGLEVNFGNGWEEVLIEDEGYGAGMLIFNEPSHQAQFRIAGEGQLDLKATMIHQSDAIGGPGGNFYVSNTLVASGPKIIRRSEWGADEELRIWNPDRYKPSTSSGPKVDPCAAMEEKYRNEFNLSHIKEYTSDGQPLTWPLQYAKNVDKFVVHHTDSEVRDVNGDSLTDTGDYKEMVRLIYNYHTLTRGWGDIGYNYLIDPLGNVYEGRYGGDKVIGAHSLCFNHGTMGIAVIGRYDSEQISEPAKQALIRLLAAKGREHGVDPSGTTVFRGKNLANAFGHRDVRPTSCPGDALYSILPEIRSRATLAMRNFSENPIAASEYDYNAELVGSLDKPSLGPGERKKLTLKFKNTGKKTWDDTTWMHAALNNDPNARIVPAVAGKSFVAADLKESSVKPGSTGTFEIEVEGGYKPGHFAFKVSPVVNGRFRISRASQFVNIQVEAPNYDYQVVSHKFPSGTVFEGQHIVATLQLKNTGNATWRNYGASPIALGTTAPRDRASIFVKENPFRVGYLNESEVKPGEIGNFTLNLIVPEDQEGEIIERFAPVIEGVNWLDDKALGFKVNLKEPVHLARTNKLERLGYMFPGERRYVQVEMENRGDLPWNSTTVETTLLGRGMKVFKRMLLPTQEVRPGQKMDVGFWVEAPLTPGQHSIYLRSRFNEKPIRGAVANFIVEVPSPELRGVKVAQSESTVEVKPGQSRDITVTFKNTGNTVWKKKGYHAVRLGTSNPNDRTSRLHHDSWINEQRLAELQEEEVMPGDIGTFRFKIHPEIRGRFREDFQLVMERYGWIDGATMALSANVTQTATNKPVPKVSTSVPAPKSPDLSASVVDVPKTTQPTASDDLIRIRLSHEGDSANVTADKAFLVLNEKDQALFNFSGGKKVTVKRVANSFHITAGSTTKTASVVRFMPKAEDGIVEILSMERRPAWNQDLNDNRFRGIVEMRIVDGQVAYINELTLEYYLRGLAEVSNSAPIEKQKTIAVLARTYARFYMDEENRKFPGKPYDGSDDPAVYQRYLGYGVESRSPNFVSAAHATRDVVVTYNGELVKTPYFNQSDGRTRSAQEVWGWTHTPYLKSVSDPWSSGKSLNGHGVGLSGLGATKQAEEGKTFEEIIKYYYTGVAVEKISD